jgi:galactofuranosylgalactofuranosylrhamnosyl-N-acetylglucosaminyl-diphospho-decaprenol beta-1,5/1,6-galactofuranosyltransferase
LYKFQINEIVNFGQFFNSFFEDQIAEISGLHSIALEVVSHGAMHICVFRDIPGVGGRAICEITLDYADEPVASTINIDLVKGKGSRLRFEVRSRQMDSVLHSAKWTTKTIPRNRVKLAVITTTFKNEILIDQNVCRILFDEAIQQKPIELIVIDNASSYTPSITDDRLHIIPQGNVGGAGGFTRGMYEVTHGFLKDRGFTHVLLMDDDIEVHVSSILRIVTLYEYTEKTVSLGGSMLDLSKPDTLFEAGAFSCRRTPVGSHNDVIYGNASDFHNLDSVGKFTNYDYCGWWFFSLPIAAIRQIGLPKPLFIRGDDVDYGERLNDAGYKVYCLGGVGVWHLHFLEKPISWIVYYVFRNHLILLSTSHQNRKWSKDAILNYLRNIVFYNVCQYDYGHAALVLLATEDFMAGPKLLRDEKAENLLKKVVSTYNEYKSDKDPDHVPIIPNTARQPDKKIINYIKKVSLNYQRGILKKQTIQGFEVIHGEFPPLWKHTPEKNGYLLVDTSRNVKRIYERNDELAIKLHHQSIKRFERLEKIFDKVVLEYQENQDDMHDVKYWKMYFEANDCILSK